MKSVKFLNVVLLQVALSAVFTKATSNTSPPGNNIVGTSAHDNDMYNVTSSDHSGSSSPFNQPGDESTSSNGLQPEGNQAPDDTVKVTEIHSSFEEITKSNLPKEKAVVNDGPPVQLNQGTFSEEFSDSETLGILSVTDSATAELQNRVVSVSTDIKVDNSAETSQKINTTNDPPPPPIIILPPGDSGFSFSSSGGDLQTKASSPLPKADDTQTPEPSQPPVVRAEPKIVTKPEDSEIVDQNVGGVSSESDSVDTLPPDTVNTQTSEPTTTSPPDLISVPTSESPHEEIPSFSEWTQKQLEEAEKKKGQNKTSSSSPTRMGAPSKVLSKNYASPDCGAKIVAANTEAENPNGVLSSSKDEYVLNKCTTQRKWLIIELCEPVQAKKLELANFELFSSSPKDFSVSLSHNYPSREWSSVGQFTAQDERVTQSFNLHPHLFGKFLKVEFNSHHGHEHFCCTSLIRVYGTSEFEVLETENELEEAEEDGHEDEQPIGADMGKPTKNLFGHATEAVYSIVKKAAEALVNSGDSQTLNSFTEHHNTSAIVPAQSIPPMHCSTLRHLVVCNNCSEDFFNKVYNLLSCRSQEMQALIETPFVLDGINSSQLCSIYGLDFILRRSLLRIKHEDQLDHAGYLAAMLPAEYISALCNILAVLEGKVVLNNSFAAAYNRGINLTIKPPQETRDLDFKKIVIEPEVAPTCSVDESFSSSHCQSRDSKTAADEIGVATSAPGSTTGSSQHSSIASMIRPTKTLSEEEDNMESILPSGEAQVPISVPLYVVTPKITSVVEPSITIVQQPVMNNLERRSSSTESYRSGQPSSIVSEMVTPEPPVIELPTAREVPDAGDGLDAASAEEQENTRDLDAIFSEMKALDNNEEATTESNPSTTPSSVVTQTRIPAQQAQKESVFLRLSNRIKALERNMSLSGQYLEELSRRYKKQEELSRALNKTLVLLREEVKRSREKESQRDNDMNFLKSKVLELAGIVESLHAEKGSWQQKAAVLSQHLIVIILEVVMFGVVVWVCRRLPSDSITSPPHRKLSSVLPKYNRPSGKPRRRNSYEDMRSSKEHKERRPSEELLYISGSYQDLLLKNNKVVVVEGVDLSPSVDTSKWSSVSNRDQRRKRKRRKDLLMKSNSSENLNFLSVNNSSSSRKISAPSHSFSLSTQSSFENNTTQEPVQHAVVPKPTVLERTPVDMSESADTPTTLLTQPKNGFPNADIVSTFPSFMETASSARNRRSSNLGEKPSAQMAHPVLEWNNGHDVESGSSVSQQSSQSRGLDDQTSEHTSSQSDSKGASVTGLEKKKKVIKKGGLKNMVKKFF